MLNKADYLNTADRETVIAFLRQVLQEQASVESTTPIYLVSARQALAAKQAGERQRLMESGLISLEDALTAFFQREKRFVLVVAVSSKLTDVLQEALLEMELTVKALELPIDELTDKQALLAQKLNELTVEQRLASDLLTGDRKRAIEFLESQADALRQKARIYLENIVAAQLSGGDRRGLEQAVQLALAAAVPSFFDQEMTVITERFREYIDSVLVPHHQRAETLVNAVRLAAASIFSVDYHAKEQAVVFHMKRQPYWVKEEWQTSLGGISYTWLEKFLPAAVRLARVRKRLAIKVDELVTRNVENLRWALMQNAETVFYSFGESLKIRLSEAVSATSQAVAAAAAQKQGQEDAVSREFTHLQEQALRLRQLAICTAALPTDAGECHLDTAQSVNG